MVYPPAQTPASTRAWPLVRCLRPDATRVAPLPIHATSAALIGLHRDLVQAVLFPESAAIGIRFGIYHHGDISRFRRDRAPICDLAHLCYFPIPPRSASDLRFMPIGIFPDSMSLGARSALGTSAT
jgi:hypothetical protein